MTSKPSLVGHTRIRRDVYLSRSHLLQQMLTPHCESVTMVPCCRNVRTTADQISRRFTHHQRQGSRAQRPAVLTANRPAEMARKLDYAPPIHARLLMIKEAVACLGSAPISPLPARPPLTPVQGLAWAVQTVVTLTSLSLNSRLRGYR